MARKFLTPIDLGKLELQNAAIQSLAGAPSSPVKFQLYGNTTDNTLYWWDGTVWQPAKSGAPSFGSVTQEQTFGAVKNDGVATTVARSDHAHGNPVHDNAAHSAVNLNALAAPTGHVNMGGFRINNLADPSAATDATTKQYVDNLTMGLGWKDYCRAATTTNITLSGAQTVDGVALVQGDRCLVKNQTTPSQNGIYDVYSTAWTRAPDQDVAGEFPGAAVFISEGTLNKDTSWVCTTDAPITVGTTNITWVQFSGPGTITPGAGLTQTGNQLDVGAGTGITVAADSVALDTAFTDGRYVDHTEINGYVPTSRTISTTAPLTGGGALSGNLTLAASASSESATGVIEIATQAEANTGTDDARAITPLKMQTSVLALINASPTAAKRFAQDVGGATSQVITHGLGTLDVIIQVYRKASPFDQIECDIEHTSTTTATLRFAAAPAAAEYRVVALA